MAQRGLVRLDHSIVLAVLTNFSATWVGWYAVDHFFPEHQVWSQFVTEAVQTAQNLDALRASHAVEVAVKDALEVEVILISKSKFSNRPFFTNGSTFNDFDPSSFLSRFSQSVHIYLKGIKLTLRCTIANFRCD